MTGQSGEQASNTTFGRVKSALAPWLAWFSTFSLPARFLIGAFVSAVGSAGAVGVVTKLGAYWFVLYYRVRTPADGLPYVAETAAAFSFVLLATAAVVYAAAYLAFRLLLTIADRKDEPAEDRTPSWIVIPLFLSLWTIPLALYLADLPQSAVTFGAIAGYQSAQGLWMVRMLRHVPIWKVAVVPAVLTVGLSFVLWLPPVYGQFLRTIGHGGGRYCTVHLSGEPFPRKIEGYLVVRTGTALLMFDGKEQTVEIPLEHVLRIEQPTKVYWCLPGNYEPRH